MSSQISPLENTVNLKGGITVNPAMSLSSMNEALQQALKNYDTSDKSIIIRCESLPRYEGNNEQMTEVFDQLLSTIFYQPFNGSQLFLYINCRESKDIESFCKPGFKAFEVVFQTNITTDDEWRRQIVPVLKKCDSLLSRMDATLLVNTQTSKGCLFVISLQGKF